MSLTSGRTLRTIAAERRACLRVPMLLAGAQQQHALSAWPLKVDPGGLVCAKSGHSRASASGPMYLLPDSSTGYDLPPRRQRPSFGGGEYQGYARRRKEAARPWSSRGDQLPAFVSSCAGALAGAHERFKPVAFLAARPNQVFLTAISFAATNQLHRPARRQRFRKTPPNQ